MTDTVERIQHEIAHLDDENATLADALADARVHAEAAREEIAGLREQLAEAESENASIREQIVHARNAFDAEVWGWYSGDGKSTFDEMIRDATADLKADRAEVLQLRAQLGEANEIVDIIRQYVEDRDCGYDALAGDSWDQLRRELGS